MDYDIVQEIKNKLLNKAGLLNSRVISKQTFLSSDLYNNILKNTSFLDSKNPSVGERIYCVYHNITNILKCPGCNKDLNFRMFKYGYFKTCNKSSCVRSSNEWKSCSETKLINNKLTTQTFSNQIENKQYEQKSLEECIKFIKDRVQDTNSGRLHQFVNNKYIRNNADILISILYYTNNLVPINIEDLNWSERFYILYNNLTTIPVCTICSKKVKYISFAEGYQRTCSTQCGNIIAPQNRVLNHFNEFVKPNVIKQNFEILNEEQYDGLAGILKLKCLKCGKVIERCLNNGQSVDIYCPGCYGDTGVSKKEKQVLEYIKTVYKDKIEENYKFQKINKSAKELDIYIPSKNIAIEYNGLYWHSENNLHSSKSRDYHLSKTLLCEQQNTRLIHIFEDEWIHKEKIIKARLKNILGLTKRSIYARKCIIQVVPIELKNKFLNKYHIQGEDKSSVHLGAFYKNRLVAIMTFGNRRVALGASHKEGSWELIRFCTIGNFNIVGIAGKLLKHFETNYKPQEIISYADRRWSQGNMYYKLGFKLKQISKPNY